MWNKGMTRVRMATHTRTVALVIGLCIPSALPARADVVLQWDAIAVGVLTTQTPQLNPFTQARFAAIVQLAVFEAVNATTEEYQGYLGSPAAPAGVPIVAPAGASSEAAAIAAAHAVLKNYFPGNGMALDAQRDASLGAIPDSPAKANGVATGLAAAAAMIALRTGDGSSPAAFYMPPSPVPAGEWDITPGCPLTAGGTPQGGVFFHWPNVKPFGVPTPAVGSWTEDFRPAPPPDITSTLFQKDYDEVRRVGGVGSPERSENRSINARFYAALSPTYLFHSVARQLAEGRVRAQKQSLTTNARILALVSIATSDSLVASFEAKYHYLYWRPVTAIRATDDPGFTPFITTPCFPSYPSNHASGSNAAIETLRRIFGAAGHEITLSGNIPAVGQVTLNYASLEQISQDVDDARVYGGIHYRFDQDAGARLGREVGTYVVKNNLGTVP